jgi:hypothetical protein
MNYDSQKVVTVAGGRGYARDGDTMSIITCTILDSLVPEHSWHEHPFMINIGFEMVQLSATTIQFVPH